MASDSAVILILFVVIILLIALLSGSTRLSRRKNWLIDFENAGYEVSEEYLQDIKRASTKDWWHLLSHSFVSKWAIRKQNVSFFVHPYSTGSGKNRRQWFGVEFSMPSQISDALDLKVERRGFFSKVFGLNKGEYKHFNKNFAITGSNIMLVKFLFNNSYNLRELEEATNYCSKFDLDKVSKFRVSQSSSKLTRACDEVLDLINVFRKYVIDSEGKSRYSIQEIMEDFDLDKVDLVCVICYQRVKVENAGVLDCCSSIGHLSHLKQWLEDHDVCPYCREPHVVLLDPIVG